MLVEQDTREICHGGLDLPMVLDLDPCLVQLATPAEPQLSFPPSPAPAAVTTLSPIRSAMTPSPARSFVLLSSSLPASPLPLSNRDSSQFGVWPPAILRRVLEAAVAQELARLPLTTNHGDDDHLNQLESAWPRFHTLAAASPVTLVAPDFLYALALHPFPALLTAAALRAASPLLLHAALTAASSSPMSPVVVSVATMQALDARQQSGDADGAWATLAQLLAAAPDALVPFRKNPNWANAYLTWAAERGDRCVVAVYWTRARSAAKSRTSGSGGKSKIVDSTVLKSKKQRKTYEPTFVCPPAIIDAAAGRGDMPMLTLMAEIKAAGFPVTCTAKAADTASAAGQDTAVLDALVKLMGGFAALPYTAAALEHAVSAGRLPIITWWRRQLSGSGQGTATAVRARVRGLSFDLDAMARAGFGQRQFATVAGFATVRAAADAASPNGLVKVQFVKRPAAAATAAARGDVDATRWILDHSSLDGSRLAVTPALVAAAARAGQLPVLQLLATYRGFSASADAVNWSSMNGHLPVLDWLAGLRVPVSPFAKCSPASVSNIGNLDRTLSEDEVLAVRAWWRQKLDAGLIKLSGAPEWQQVLAEL
ncbi:hypothetical protein BC828DRAFT_405369 [Blastocladiella britannica]|nr:hypothetical protein BC828DRAFT_405369 [Blastocladiella britannica]